MPTLTTRRPIRPAEAAERITGNLVLLASHGPTQGKVIIPLANGTHLVAYEGPYREAEERRQTIAVQLAHLLRDFFECLEEEWPGTGPLGEVPAEELGGK